MSKLIFALFITAISFGQESIYHNPDQELTIGNEYALFGNNVKFRETPDITSKVIEVLPIHTPVKIMAKSDKKILYNGIESSFYEVEYNDKKGYILGGLIAIEKKAFKNSTYLFAFKKATNYYELVIRHIDVKGEISETITELKTPEFLISLFDNKGIDTIENILFIDYLAEACGVDGGGIVFFQTKDELKKVFEIVQVSEAGIYWVTENLIFPKDENGISNKIVYQKETGTYKDEDSNWIETITNTRELSWDNNNIVPSLKDID